jgi:hypothetical protein
MPCKTSIGERRLETETGRKKLDGEPEINIQTGRYSFIIIGCVSALACHASERLFADVFYRFLLQDTIVGLNGITY